jgi:hypothetical protein
MGNCTGYCTGCKDGGEPFNGGATGGRYDNNQVRNSYNAKDAMMREGFGGEAFSVAFGGGRGGGGYSNNNGDTTTGADYSNNNNGSSSGCGINARMMRQLDRNSLLSAANNNAADNGEYDSENMYRHDLAGHH